MDYGIEGGANLDQYKGENPSFNRLLPFGLSEIQLPYEDPYFGSTAIALVNPMSQEICGVMLGGPQETRVFTKENKEAMLSSVPDSMGELYREHGIGANFDYEAPKVSEDLEQLRGLLESRLGDPDGMTASNNPMWFAPQDNIYALEIGRQSSETHDEVTMTVVFDKVCTRYRRRDDVEFLQQQEQAEKKTKERNRNSPICEVLRNNGNVELPPSCL